MCFYFVKGDNSRFGDGQGDGVRIYAYNGWDDVWMNTTGDFISDTAEM